jgi:hypothetical protein
MKLRGQRKASPSRASDLDLVLGFYEIRIVRAFYLFLLYRGMLVLLFWYTGFPFTRIFRPIRLIINIQVCIFIYLLKFLGNVIIIFFFIKTKVHFPQDLYPHQIFAILLGLFRTFSRKDL